MVKGFAGDITVAQGMPSRGLLWHPTDVVPIYQLAVTHFQTTASAGAGACDGGSLRLMAAASPEHNPTYCQPSILSL